MRHTWTEPEKAVPAVTRLLEATQSEGHCHCKVVEETALKASRGDFGSRARDPAKRRPGGGGRGEGTKATPGPTPARQLRREDAPGLL